MRGKRGIAPRQREPAGGLELGALNERKAELDAQRAAMLPRLKEALEAERGNVTRAGRLLWPDIDPKLAQARAWNWTRDFALVPFARELREKRGQVRGRPPGGKGSGSDQKKKMGSVGSDF